MNLVNLLNAALERVTYPFKRFKLYYLSLLAVYFSVGFNALTSVTNSFFIKEKLHLSPAELISIGIWAALPWSIKMFFGSIIDSVKLFGNNRKNYIYFGNFLIAIGTLGMVDHTSTGLIFSLIGQYAGLVLTGLITTIGVVTCDIIADTMAIEITDKQEELTDIQVWSRLSLSVGAVLGASITGFLASQFSDRYHFVYLISLLCPFISTIGTLFTNLKHVPEHLNKLDIRVLVGGLLFGLVSIFSGSISKNYGTLIMFLFASLILALLFKEVVKEIDKKTKKAFIFSMLALFLFRITPGYGSGVTWFYMDVLKFDEMFFGKIDLIGSLSALLVLWFFMKTISNGSIFKSLAVLTIFTTLLSLPDIIVYYKLNEIIGVSAKSLVLINGAMSSPVANLAMVPMGVIIAKNAPKSNRAVYITVTAGLMNLALVGGDVATEILNRIFIIERGEYSKLGKLMISSLALSTFLSLFGLVLLKKGLKK